MRFFILFSFFFLSFPLFSQVKRSGEAEQKKSSALKLDPSKEKISSPSLNSKSMAATSTAKDTVAKIDWYKIISYHNKITEVDTTLTIKKFQEFNFLGRDMFGMQTMSNDGQSYNILNYALFENQSNPKFGFNAKEWNYYQINDINNYKVPTPFSELSYRSVTKQGQNLNTLFTTNFNERLNVFIGYRALRSLGAYLNELNSIGNFKLGGSYNTKEERYFLNTNITVQDIMNQENGGITDIDLFEDSSAPYNSRERLNVYSRDANSLFKGIRTYLDHKFKFNSSTENEIWLKHQFFYEYKTNLFEQYNLSTFESEIQYFGESYAASIRDKVRFRNFYNKVTLAYNSKVLGELAFNVDYSNLNYFYNSIVFDSNGSIIPSSLTYDLVTLGGSYAISKEKFAFKGEVRQSISNIPTTEIKGNVNYKIDEEFHLQVGYQFLSKIPDMTQQLFQSTYVNYNWKNNFSNEKIQKVYATFHNPYVNLSGDFQMINDKIYFSNNNTILNHYGIPEQQIVSPKQYNKTIGYFNIKAQREFKFGKFGLDNTLLFQQVTQDDNIVNVPSFVTRNTIYYTDKLFKNALFLQTGIVFNYHTKYYANEYNPVLSEFFVQDTRKVGGFPTFDFFVNAKIKTARVFISLEHFNSKFTGYNYFVTPTRPFSDMRLRFGIVWDFFN